MCGIIGYIGYRQSSRVILEGLKRMEYRGYDSAGLAIIDSDKSLKIIKKPGKVSSLAPHLSGIGSESLLGIGHTRWATHGEPNEINAHPHTDSTGKIAVIHNGIIENYTLLKKKLINKGHVFRTDTDTEVIAHLIEDHYTGSLDEAVRKALLEVNGTYGLLVVSSDEPDKIIGAKLGSPLIIGIGRDENFLASDLSAMIACTKDFLYLEDREMVIVTRDDRIIKTIDDVPVNRMSETVDYDITLVEKAGYDHFMLKEIHEQPQTILEACRGRLIFSEGTARFGVTDTNLNDILNKKRIILTACGTSWHAALIGEYLFEELARIPVEVEYASEFRYRDPVLSKDDLVIAVSQSGETADTIAAIKEAKRKGTYTLGICNVVGSTISRLTDGGCYLHAGPEIGVASTKAFTSQVTVLILLALILSRSRVMSILEGQKALRELKTIPDKIRKILDQESKFRDIAKKYSSVPNCLYLGRGYNFPVALEGALKLKEISYIHAEGYPAAEMKHGPIALIDENMPVVFIAINDGTYEKIFSNIAEVKARKGKVIAIVNEGDTEIESKVDDVIYIPETLQFLTPLLTVIPLQLLAYYIAVERGCNVDQPKNLAKSVTVE